MVGLTTKQKEELNTAILEYLLRNNYDEAARVFQEEAAVSPPDPNASSIKKDLLEKKWTSVVRLKKQVMELEKQTK
jgi:platelet-activating factor acetylhydrolase IB subunit alpha